ncbi:SpoIIE family protein phosphatase [candidate division KSB1 bacterium]|nr:SpoIIE family protein phosphatase [candidate division KSB1 bacterium]
MLCSKCHAENPSRFHHCGECGSPLFLAMLKEIGDTVSPTTYHIFSSGATLGRHFDNTIVLLDYSISRYHARIDFQDGKFFIQDLSSSNGVRVNEVRVKRRELKDFDRLTMGKVLLLFRTSSLTEEEIERNLPTQDRFLAAIKDINQSAKSAAISHHILEIAAEFAISLTRAERAIIFLYDKNLKLHPAVFHNVGQQELERDEFEVCRSAMQEAEHHGEMLIREELLHDPRFNANQSIQALQLNTIICLPLKSPHAVEISTTHDAEERELYVKGVLFGMLYLDSRKPLKGMPQYRKTMLQVLADQTSLAIENAILQREMAEKKKLKQQMGAAKAAQLRLFPEPSFSHARFDMAYHYAAAQQIGGDYLTFLPLSETRFLFAIGDVVGKGLPAGLVVMTVHGGLYSEISHQEDIPAMMRSLDRLVHEYAEGKVFVTFFIAVLDVEKMTLQYANAGHNPPLLHRSMRGEWLELRAAGVPLGLNANAARTAELLQLMPGDFITFYTDGITEAHDENRKQFGLEGVKKVLSNWLAAQARTPEALHGFLNAVVERVRHFTNNKPPEDDTTIMAVMMK